MDHVKSWGVSPNLGVLTPSPSSGCALADAASKCSVSNAIRIRIRPNSPKPLFGTPLSFIFEHPHVKAIFGRRKTTQSKSVPKMSFLRKFKGLNIICRH